MDKDFSKCNCENAGWCDLFKKEMTYKPPNWQWCKSLTPAQREAYHEKATGALRTIRKAMRASQVDICNFSDQLPEPTSDYAVCVIPAHGNAIDLLAVTRGSIKKYAEKCGADYIELTGNQHEFWPMANKYRVSQVVEKYKKTVYLDCDVLVKPNAPNLFEITPDDKISGYDEWELWEDAANTRWIDIQQELILNKVKDLPVNRDDFYVNGKFQPRKMINGGVLVIPQSLGEYYQQPEYPYPRQWCFDQNYLSIILPDDKFHNLDYRFNCEYTALDFYLKHRESFFIHVNNMVHELDKRINLLQLVEDNDTLDLELAVHEDVSTSVKYDLCPFAIDHQKKENVKLKEYIKGQTREKKYTANNDVCILALGHSEEQFRMMEKRPYLKNVNLNKIDAGDFSDNCWAEARIFLTEDNYFDEDKEFWGVITASWNRKYYLHNKIDNFHKWFASQVLLNSKPEDGVVICADMFCYCNWTNDKSTIHGKHIMASVISEDIFDTKTIGRTFWKMIGVDVSRHRRVPYSNQFIVHKSHYKRYIKWLYDGEYHHKLKWFVDKYILVDGGGFVAGALPEEYTALRTYAYFFEMLSIGYWSVHYDDYKFISTTQRQESWYDREQVRDRMATWTM